MSFYKESFVLLRPYLKYFVFTLVFVLLSAYFTIFSFSLIQPFLEILFYPEKIVYVKPTFEFSIEYFKNYFYFYLSSIIEKFGNLYSLAFVCILLVILFFLKNIATFFSYYLLLPIRINVANDLRIKFYDKIFNLPVNFFSDKKKGDLISRQTSDINEIEGSLVLSIFDLFRAPISVITFLGVMVFISYKLTLISLLLIPFTGFIIGKVGRSLKRNADKGQIYHSNIMTNLEESLSGIKLIKLYNSELFFTNRYENLLNEHRKNYLKMLGKKELASPLSESLGSIFMSLVIWFGGLFVFKNETSPGSLIVFITMFYSIISPAKAISASYFNIQKCWSSMKRVYEILDIPTEKINEENKKEFIKFNDKISIKNIQFSYDNVDILFNDFNLEIIKGSKTAIVGSSGSGKTTLFELLYNNYPLSKGGIYFDNLNIKDIKPSNLKKILGVIPQDPFLFNDTIYNNINFGSITNNKEDIINAAKLAHIDQFIQTLPNGYDTIVGDRGANLSGGQRQRIGIARALLRNPEIILMDESTSALDIESENIIYEAVRETFKNKTVIIISHRLTSLKWLDDIVILDKGKIIDRGSYKTLSSNNSSFHKMLNIN